LGFFLGGDGKFLHSLKSRQTEKFNGDVWGFWCHLPIFSPDIFEKRKN
jgi:hypothetical protein